MNHKRKRTKRQRSGCLMCKPWKANGENKIDHFKPSERRKLQEEKDRPAQ